jgi:3-dehydroquinate synthetase
MSTLAQSDLEAKEHAERRAVQSEAEARRLSAEVARLREERDAARAEVDRALAEMGRAVVEADAAEKAIRGFRDFGEGLAHPFGGRSRHVITAGQVLIGMADKALAALASLGSPQDERNTKKEDAHA